MGSCCATKKKGPALLREKFISGQQKDPLDRTNSEKAAVALVGAITFTLYGFELVKQKLYK